jgi:hypothetical protein
MGLLRIAESLASGFTFEEDASMTTIEAVEPAPFIDGIVYGEGPRWRNDRSGSAMARQVGRRVSHVDPKLRLKSMGPSA